MSVPTVSGWCTRKKINTQQDGLLTSLVYDWDCGCHFVTHLFGELICIDENGTLVLLFVLLLM